MGVQSLDETMLERLGRIHTREMVFQSFDLLRRAGFDNLNVDLMFAIPGQTLDLWREHTGRGPGVGQRASLLLRSHLRRRHAAVRPAQGAANSTADEDLACVLYEELQVRAAAAGFQQYEIANFARDTTLNSQPSTPNLPSYACRHNVNYWRGGSFHGLGPSATSYVRGVRTKNWSNTVALLRTARSRGTRRRISRSAAATCRGPVKPPRSVCAWSQVGRSRSSAA